MMASVAGTRSGRTRWVVPISIGVVSLLLAILLALLFTGGRGNRTTRSFVVSQRATHLTSFACESATRCFGSEGGVIFTFANGGQRWHAVAALRGAAINNMWCDPLRGRSEERRVGKECRSR